MLVLSIFVFSVGIALCASRLVSNAQNINDPHYYKYYTSVVIYPGDTLTSLAEEYGDHFESAESFIKDVQLTNHMYDDKIIAGTNLIIPYYSTEYKH